MSRSLVAAILGVKAPDVDASHGPLGWGYGLWATHPDGDIIARCGRGQTGWFDRYTPVLPGETPDFTLTIGGRRYRLTRAVEHALPAGFERAAVLVPWQAPKPRVPAPRLVIPLTVARANADDAAVKASERNLLALMQRDAADDLAMEEWRRRRAMKLVRPPRVPLEEL